MFDIVIVTAANKAQAAGYKAQLKGRKNFIVVPDPGDRRVGSLGATVNVLRALFRKKAVRKDSKILISAIPCSRTVHRSGRTLCSIRRNNPGLQGNPGR